MAVRVRRRRAEGREWPSRRKEDNVMRPDRVSGEASEEVLSGRR